jgi:two-component system, chemotaxis family, sensor kinase CheA
VQGLAVGVEGETYVLPLDHVIECVELERERSVASSVGGVLELRGEALPYLSLARAVGAREDAGAHANVVVVEQDGRRAGLAVDHLHGEVQTVIKPFGSLLDGVRGFAGSALLADGRVALVVDVRGLLRSAVG